VSRRAQISPSILSADFARLADELAASTPPPTGRTST
jgi:pentose-5-phosphate-3-epimerase